MKRINLIIRNYFRKYQPSFVYFVKQFICIINTRIWLDGSALVEDCFNIAGWILT